LHSELPTDPGCGRRPHYAGSRHAKWTRETVLPLLLVLGALGLAYLSTLQATPNGGDHYYMADVGETQIVLNVWGTLHATGYPLYVIIGNLVVHSLKAIGVHAAAAPALVSMLWTMVAGALLFWLGFHLTGRAVLSAGFTLLFGLTRTVWLHSSIAEVYTMDLAILAVLLLLALWQRDLPHRFLWLCLVGGIGLAHHRLLVTVAPALLFAVWPPVSGGAGRLARLIVLGVVVGMVGFLPYVYLPLRGGADDVWVYDEPGTWDGFWDQFTGREAGGYVRLPRSVLELASNIREINQVLVDELTIIGLPLGLAGLVLAVRRPQRRVTAAALLLSASLPYGFHVLLWHTYPMPALTLPTTLSVALGWLLLADEALYSRPGHRKIEVGLVPATILLGLMLVRSNFSFIRSLTLDTTGLQTIALVRNAPADSTVMMEWGPRYAAASFAHDVLGDLEHISLVDHQADFGRIVSEGVLVTPEYTFYNRPLGWWEEVLGTRVYLRAVAPYLVQVDTQFEEAHLTPAGDAAGPIFVRDKELACTEDSTILKVAWVAARKPERDLSVFVHLLDTGGKIVAQADQLAPVYGWRPTSTWRRGEVVRDVYALPRMQGAETILFGLYQQLGSGQFQNEVEFRISVNCGD
jgi:hypothetical protein